LSSSLTGNSDESIGSKVVGAVAGLGTSVIRFFLLMVLLLILLLQLSGATSPERHVSGEGSSAEIESSDLGRKGRAGATGEIFTAGMFDLSGQFFYLKKSDCEIVQSDRFEFSFLKSQPSLPVATKLKQLNDQAFNNKHTHADFRIDVGGGWKLFTTF
jgi:hypothetical protein